MNNHREICKIVLIYAVFGCSWIYFSDTAVNWLVRNPEIVTKISIIKGMLFIILTSVLLYLLILRFNIRIKQSADALLEVKQQLHYLVKNSSDSLVIVNADGSQRYVSPGAERITGYPIAELEGRTLDTLIHPDDMQDIRAAWNEAVAHPEKTVTVQYRHIHKTRGWVYSEAIAQSFLTDPAVKGIIASVRDITEHRRAEEALKNSNTLLQTIINTAPVSIFFKDLELRFLGCNTAFAQDAGVECPEDLIGKDDYQLVWKEQADLYRSDDRRVIESGIPKLSYEEPQTTPQGNVIWLRTSKVPLRNEAGEIIGVLGMYEDITERKRMEQELQDQSAKLDTERKRSEEAMRIRGSYLSAIIENQPGLLWLKDPEGRFLTVNTEFAKSCGLYDPELLVGKNDADIWPQDLAGRYIADDLKVLKSGKPLMVEEPIADNGHITWFETFKTPVFDSRGRVIGTTGFAHNITERKQAENALRESEDKFRLTFDFSPDAIAINRLDDGLYVDINEGFCRATGFARDDIIGKTARECGIWQDADERRHFAHEIRKRGLLENFEAQFRKKDGSLIIGLVSARVISVKDVLHIITITRNITERKKHDEEQLKIEKLESLGILAGGIAHDFNNILTGIMGNISFAKVFLADTHKSYRPLAEAEKAAVRAGELAHQLLTFARGGEPIKKVVAVRQLVDETLSFVLHGSNVKGSVDIPDSIHAIEADGGQMSQVFRNIIINATQAMPGGGILTITARNELLGDGNVVALAPGPYIRLTFADQGCGIADDNLNKIFDPYFTTKSTGTGLGLASAYSIISRHRGHISVSSEAGKGAVFTIFLPSIGETRATGKGVATARVVEGHKAGSILIMDDEGMIRDIASSMLTYLGYEVTTCSKGEEALELYKAAMEAGAPFSAVILDLTIPGGLGGKETAQQILHLFPKARLIVSSGYSNDPIMSNYHEYGFSRAMAKPYNIDEFTEVLGALSGT